MTNYVVHCEPAKIYVSPTGFLVYARDFLEAHKSHKPEKPFSPASYYLICRSLELSLKAFLLTKGVTRPEIRDRKKLGHNLQKILERAFELDINSVSPISSEQVLEIEKANNWYARKGFEYFEIKNIVDGKETLPDLNVLVEFAERLAIDLEPLCLSAA